MPTSLTLFTLQQKFHSHTYIHTYKWIGSINALHMRLLSYAAVTVMVVATTSHQPNGSIKGLPPIKEDARGATSISMLQSTRHYARKWTKWGAFSRTRSAYRGAGTPLHQSHGREYSCTIYVSQCTCHLLPTHPSPHTQTMPEAPHYVRRSHILSVYTLYNWDPLTR